MGTRVDMGMGVGVGGGGGGGDGLGEGRLLTWVLRRESSRSG